MNQYDLDTNNKQHSQKACLFTLIAFIAIVLVIFLASCSHRMAAPVHPAEQDTYIDKAPQK